MILSKNETETSKRIIKAYDSICSDYESVKQKLDELENERKELAKKLEELRSVDKQFFESLLQKYGKGREKEIRTKMLQLKLHTS